MSVFCACTDTGANGNTGKSSASLQLKRASLYFLMYRFADDGTKNVINASDFINGVLPDTYIQEKINHIDPSKRWYPVIDLRAVTDVRAEPNTQSFDGGQNNIITSEGLRVINATVIDANAKYKKNLDKLACNQLAYFMIDECGALGGETAKSDETILEPHPIAKKTFYVNLTRAQGTDGQTLLIQWEVDQISQDANECIAPAGSVETDLLEVNGLLNLIATVSSISITGFTVALALEYGGFASKKAVSGLVAADFTIFNLTTDSAVVISTFTETSTAGTYDVTFAAQTAADVLELRQAFTGNKYDKEGFELDVPTITIP